MIPDAQVRLDCPPVDLAHTLGPMRQGVGDPTTAVGPDGGWWATRIDGDPVALRIRAAASDRTGLATTVEASAWGPGAGAALGRVAGLVGADDPLEEFRPPDGPIARLLRERPGARMGRTGAVFEALLPAILGQKVIGREAKRSLRRFVRDHGEDAPGPAELRLLPPPARVAALPYHAWHPLGVERRRADIVRRAAREAPRLEADAGDPDRLRTRLEALPGVGRWTVANVAITALGDPDAVVLGDHNLPHTVAWLLAGEPRATDERMLELLEPYRGNRARVQRLAKSSGIRPPRRGPKLAFREIERT